MPQIATRPKNLLHGEGRPSGSRWVRRIDYRLCTGTGSGRMTPWPRAVGERSGVGCFSTVKGLTVLLKQIESLSGRSAVSYIHSINMHQLSIVAGPSRWSQISSHLRNKTAFSMSHRTAAQTSRLKCPQTRVESLFRIEENTCQATKAAERSSQAPLFEGGGRWETLDGRFCSPDEEIVTRRAMQ